MDTHRTMVDQTLLAGRDSAGSNHIFTTADGSCSRVSHISSLVLLGDELIGFITYRGEVFSHSQLRISHLCMNQRFILEWELLQHIAGCRDVETDHVCRNLSGRGQVL